MKAVCIGDAPSKDSYSIFPVIISAAEINNGRLDPSRIWVFLSERSEFRLVCDGVWNKINRFRTSHDDRPWVISPQQGIHEEGRLFPTIPDLMAAGSP
jgi:hypothetical protein